MCNRVRVFVSACNTRKPLRFVQRLDTPPNMRWRISATVATVRERQEELVWRSMLGVAATSAFGNSDEAERLGLPNGWRHRGTVHPVLDEVICRNWELSIVIATVVGKFDLDA
jgi:hypothetical protein